MDSPGLTNEVWVDCAGDYAGMIRALRMESNEVFAIEREQDSRRF